jgi:hypothetical protein
MRTSKLRSSAGVLALGLVAMGLAVLMVPAPAAAGGCTPWCYKHPITGKIICTPPCP